MMKGSIRLEDLAGYALIALTVSAPVTASADPNESSIADIEVCIDGNGDAQVCATKELSNVVLQCSVLEGIFFVKHDDLDVAPSHSGTFACPDGGEIEAVFVKAGSGKSSVPGAPAGSGQPFFSPLDICPVECPAPGEDGEESEGDGDAPDGGDIPQ